MPIDFTEIKQLSKEAKEISNALRKELGEMPHKIEGNFIAFFGRQYNPDHKWNCALKPLWSGFYIKYNELEMMVDPGINILERAEKIGVNLARTNTLFISHSHIDHKNDSNVIAEMVSYRENPELNVLFSKHSLNDNAMSHYHSSSRENKIILLDENEEVELYNGVKLKPVEVVHSINGAYGFVLDLNGVKIGYTGDTGFNTTYKSADGRELSVSEKVLDKKDIEEPGAFNEDLKTFFSEVDLLVFNLHDVEFRKHTKHNLYHSTVSDAVKVLRDSKVKHCFFEHFNPYGGGLGLEYPQKVNQYIRESTGKETTLTPLNGSVYSLNNI
ncbi:MAG TPA: MBL fold metallo-hydrolase [Candidatus Paceibacterota bacterium]